jgi:hypothetical protein
MSSENLKNSECRITIIVSKDLKSKIQKYCIDNDTNMTELILDLLINKIK